MDPKQLRLALGLLETATEDEVQAKLASLKAAATPVKPAPAPQPSLNADEIRAIVIEAVKTEVSPLISKHTETHDGLVARTIDGYVKAGKIQPTEIARNHYVALCSTPEGLKSTCAFLDQAPALVSTNAHDLGGNPPSGASQLSDIEREVCAKLQIPEEEFIKTSPNWVPQHGAKDVS